MTLNFELQVSEQNAPCETWPPVNVGGFNGSRSDSKSLGSFSSDWTCEKCWEKFMCSLGYGLFVGMRFGCQVVNVSDLARIVGYNEFMQRYFVHWTAALSQRKDTICIEVFYMILARFEWNEENLTSGKCSRIWPSIHLDLFKNHLLIAHSSYA